MRKCGIQRILHVLGNKSFVFYHSALTAILPDITKTLSHAKLNREFHFKFEKMSVSDMVNFKITFLVLSEGISKLQLKRFERTLRTFKERLLGTADSLAHDPSLAEGLSLLKASQEKACFFSSGKSIAPGLDAQMLGSCPSISLHLLGLWTLLGLAVSFSWPWTPHPSSAPASSSSYCLVRPPGQGH